MVVKQKDSDINWEGFSIYSFRCLLFRLFDSNKYMRIDLSQVFDSIQIGRDNPKKDRGELNPIKYARVFFQYSKKDQFS